MYLFSINRDIKDTKTLKNKSYLKDVYAVSLNCGFLKILSVITRKNV